MTARSILSPLALAVGLLLVALFFFAPHLWLMRQEVPGSFEWARADGYLKQCEEPFRRDVEPALHWRLLPPLVSHAVGLRGRAALALPWVGVIAMMTLAVHEFTRRLGNIRLAALAALPLATSSAALAGLQFYGVNDGWVWLGLIACAFSPSRWALPAACLLCPWVDERFVIGLPLALVVRWLDRNEPPQLKAALPALWLGPYLAVRLMFAGDASTRHFLGAALVDSVHYAAMAPLGWWMALRAGWVAVALAFVLMPRSSRLPAGTILAVTMIASTMLAADLSRSAAIVVPLMMWGILALCRQWPERALRLVGGLGLACLLVPMANVVYTKIVPVSPLPVELLRLLRQP